MSTKLLMYKAISDLPMKGRASAYCQANRYIWPDAVASLKPAGWDALTDREKYDHPDAKTLWTVIDNLTDEFSRSEQWWLEVLGRTQEQHLEWWGKHHA